MRENGPAALHHRQDLLALLVQKDGKERRELRGTLVLWGPRERQALWVLQA